jgi:Uma2 family endonuclease
MSSILAPTIRYPESDGEPMAENTLQYEWIVTIKGGLDEQCRDDPNVFVAGDLFWYPKEGQPGIRQAPDIMAVLGRPKGHRGSYLQWEEGGIAPQVVFEIWSPGNRFGPMQKKFDFYQHYGVEEYYIYDPDTGNLEGWLRSDAGLREIEPMRGWVSPHLGIRFEMNGDELLLYHPDGQRFLTFLEQVKVREMEKKARALAEKERERAEKELQKAEKERASAEASAEKLRAQLRALGVEPQE